MEWIRVRRVMLIILAIVLVLIPSCLSHLETDLYLSPTAHTVMEHSRSNLPNNIDHSAVK